jgi:hypothetical protein
MRSANAELIKIFEEEKTKHIRIRYGEQTLTERQILGELYSDGLWALLSMLLAAVMLRVGSGSTFITLAGIFQIVVGFPSVFVESG